MLEISSASRPASTNSARPTDDCNAANRTDPRARSRSCFSAKFTAPLHRLHTPSYSTIPRSSFANSARDVDSLASRVARARRRVPVRRARGAARADVRAVVVVVAIAVGIVR
jgi:hypothetical protein